MQNRMRRVTEHADAYESDAGQRQHDRQQQNPHTKMIRRFIDGVGIQILQLQTIRGDELGNGEIADDYNADARKHQRRIEHARGEGSTVAQLGEIIVVPVRIVGRQSCDAHAGHHEKRQ